MAEYSKGEARDWAFSAMQGVANTVTPSFARDLEGLNERGIRHDIRKEIEFGFWGTLLVSEVEISLDEYRQFTEWAADEAKGRLRLIHHASFNTLAENIAAVQATEAAGTDLVLLSYPTSFYPKSAQEIYDYTKAFCEATNLGIILFPVPLWGFERLHPAGMEPDLIRRLVEDVPNIVCIKAEGGMPTIAGFVETYKKHGKDVIVTMPLESEAIPLAALVPMQFSGTSNTEYFGPMIPRIFKFIGDGELDQAMALYWQIHPARMANMQAMEVLKGSNFIHRMLWKYQAWLSGFNGGPLRRPAMRLTAPQMQALRNGLIASKLPGAGGRR